LQIPRKRLAPELWNPQTGEMSPLAVYVETAAGISIPLRLDAAARPLWFFARKPSRLIRW